MPSIDIERYTQPFWFSYSLPDHFSSEQVQLQRSLADAAQSIGDWQTAKNERIETEQLLGAGVTPAEIIFKRTGKHVGAPAAKASTAKTSAVKPLDLATAGPMVDRWLNTLGIEPGKFWTQSKTEEFGARRLDLVREALRRSQAGEDQPTEAEIRSFFSGPAPKTFASAARETPEQPSGLRGSKRFGTKYGAEFAERIKSGWSGESGTTASEAPPQLSAKKPTTQDLQTVRTPEDARAVLKQHLLYQRAQQPAYDEEWQREAEQRLPTSPDAVGEELDEMSAGVDVAGGQRVPQQMIERKYQGQVFTKVRQDPLAASPEEREIAFASAISTPAFAYKHHPSFSGGRRDSSEPLSMDEWMRWKYGKNAIEDYGIDILSTILNGEEVEQKLVALQIREWASQSQSAADHFRPLLDALQMLNFDKAIRLTPEEAAELEALRPGWLDEKIQTANKVRAQQRAVLSSSGLIPRKE